MTALIIIGSIILFFVIILSLPLVFVADYEKQAEIKLRLLFFDLFSEKKAEKRRIAKGNASVKSAKLEKAQKTAQIVKSEQPQISETHPESKKTLLKQPKPGKNKKGIEKSIPAVDIKLIRMLVDSAAHPFKKLIKKIRISELYIDSIVGGDDAAKAALNYGAQNALVYSSVGWLKSVSSVKVEQINIQADFMREDSAFNLHFKVRIKIGTVILCALIFMVKLMRIKAKETGAQNKETQEVRAKA